MAPHGSITRLLQRWRDGDGQALEQLTPLVYAELRRLALVHLRRERPNHTLQPTELVHEAFVRLIRQDTPDYQNRAHFMAIAAGLMRQILVDHARRRRRQQRGGHTVMVPLEDASPAAPEPPIDLIELDDAGGLPPTAARRIVGCTSAACGSRTLPSLDARQHRGATLGWRGLAARAAVR